jgi:hypothetical protein
MFARLQVPFETVVRTEGERYSFVNYNFCFRRLFDWYGTPHYGVDFPPLKSKKKREDAIWLWYKLLCYLKLPYINNDGKLFGAEFHTPLDELIKRRSAARNRTKRKQQQQQLEFNAGSGDSGVRRGVHENPSKKPKTEVHDEALLELLSAFDSACNDSDYGFSYDDLSGLQ